MPNLLVDITQHFMNEGLVAGDGIDAFRGHKPNEPVNLVVSTEYNSSDIDIFSKTANRYIQVLVRNEKAELARLKANALLNSLLDEDVWENLPNNRVGTISVESIPMSIGRDEKGHTEYVFNISILTTID